ncbi:MAG: hypothetical protein WAO00_02215 [Chthoniobacterales bacterium]
MNTRFLLFIRILTTTIAVAYGGESFQYGWIYWLQAHLGDPDALFWRGYNSSISVQDLGAYIASAAAVPIVFVLIPRFRWGVPALSWCYLIMAACLLSKLFHCSFWGGHGTFVMELECFGRLSCFASPPLLIGLLLRYRFVEEQLRLDASSTTAKPI